MNESEFDKFADEYHAMHAESITASGEGPEYFAEYKIRDIALECERNSLLASKTPRIIDFGAGNGGSVAYVRKYFPSAHLTCLDVSKRSLEIAEKRFPSLADYVHFDGVHIPFPEAHFDIAYAACVFHHIDHALHVPLLRELRRVIRPGGALLVFEHNPCNPLTVRVVNNCPFDVNARLIRGRVMKQRLVAAGFADAALRYRVFFPHSLRALRTLENVLTWLPLGGQYYALAKR